MMAIAERKPDGLQAQPEVNPTEGHRDMASFGELPPSSCAHQIKAGEAEVLSHPLLNVGHDVSAAHCTIHPMLDMAPTGSR